MDGNRKRIYDVLLGIQGAKKVNFKNNKFKINFNHKDVNAFKGYP